MEKFSHDLTRALEETSRVRAGHCWGVRRRTRSTGNLRKYDRDATKATDVSLYCENTKLNAKRLKIDLFFL